MKLPPHKVSKLDPVKTLHDYIAVTEKCRCIILKPVFIGLMYPFGVLCAQHISTILNEAIVLSGLGNQGFTAKCFRCSGATAAVESGADAELVRKLGRWKTSNIFYDQYVHARTPSSLIQAIIPI